MISVKLNRLSLYPRLVDRPLRRTALEEWPPGPGQRRLITIMTGGRRRKVLLRNSGITGEQETGGAKYSGSQDSSPGRSSINMLHRRRLSCSIASSILPNVSFDKGSLTYASSSNVSPACSTSRFTSASPMSAPGVQKPPCSSASRARHRAASEIIFEVGP